MWHFRDKAKVLGGSWSASTTAPSCWLGSLQDPGSASVGGGLLSPHCPSQTGNSGRALVQGVWKGNRSPLQDLGAVCLLSCVHPTPLGVFPAQAAGAGPGRGPRFSCLCSLGHPFERACQRLCGAFRPWPCCGWLCGWPCAAPLRRRHHNCGRGGTSARRCRLPIGPCPQRRPLPGSLPACSGRPLPFPVGHLPWREVSSRAAAAGELHPPPSACWGPSCGTGCALRPLRALVGGCRLALGAKGLLTGARLGHGPTAGDRGLFRWRWGQRRAPP